MCKILYGTMKAVVMKSGFCVSKDIVEFEQKGSYGASLINKRNYYPKCVHDAAIDTNFEDKDVNYCEILEASIDGLLFQVISMKEPKYVMRIMQVNDFEQF